MYLVICENEQEYTNWINGFNCCRIKYGLPRVKDGRSCVHFDLSLLHYLEDGTTNIVPAECELVLYGNWEKSLVLNNRSAVRNKIYKIIREQRKI